MTKTEYLNKRKSLYDQAQQAISKNDIERGNQLMTEIKQLDSDYENSARAQSNLEALSGIADSSAAPFHNNSLGVNLTDSSIEDSEDMYGSLEYRNAFRKFVMKGEAIPSKFTNSDSITTSSGAGVIVPTQVYERIITKLENVGKIYAKVFKTAFPASLVIPKQSVLPTASWVDEDKGSEKQSVTLEPLTFSGYKLECKLAFSLFMQVTSLDKFESQFVEQGSKAMVKAIDRAIMIGSGVGSPKGILLETPPEGQTITIAANKDVVYDTVMEAESVLPAEYEDGAVWLMNKKTLYGKFKSLKDTTGQPIVSIGPGAEGKPSKTIIGRDVIYTDGYMDNYADTVSEDTTFAVMFDLASYVFNEVMSMSITRYVDNETDNLVIKLVMLADGKTVDKNSLVKLVKAASTN